MSVFVLSMKTTRPRLFAAGAVMALLLATVAVLSAGQQAAGAVPRMTAADEAGRQEVLHSLGYEVLPDRVEVREVLIPAEFDDTFAAYNALQQAAGMDLKPYAGERVKCWTYTVINYPAADTAVQGDVVAHLYTRGERVIGGDISSTVQGGFSHGLLPLTEAHRGK